MGRRALRARGRSAAHFHKKASRLDAREAALLATALPDPIGRDAAHPSALQRRLAAAVMARAEDRFELLNCLPK
jgi:monofunctional glycosyltransferase